MPNAKCSLVKCPYRIVSHFACFPLCSCVFVCVCVQGVDGAGNVSPQPCSSMQWRVDTTAPSILLLSPANATVTRNATVDVTVDSSEPLSMLVVLQPGAAGWTEVAVSSVLQHTVTMTVASEGPHHAWLKGKGMVVNAHVWH